jgi:hypothetical protein
MLSYSLPSIRIPVEKPRSIRYKNEQGPILRGIEDPFLYNPRKVANKVCCFDIFHRLVYNGKFENPGANARRSK